MAEQRDLPLLRWAEELRRNRNRRRRLRIRLGVGLAGIIALGATVIVAPSPLLVWNASASAPIGLYRVMPGAELAAGDMVIARVAQPWRDIAAARHYLPANVPLVKRVAAIPGDTICEAYDHIFVNGRWVAWRRAWDGRGRPMPAWHGCVTLRDGALFLLMTDSPDSFDGRYFGPTRAADVVGKASLLWAR